MMRANNPGVERAAAAAGAGMVATVAAGISRSGRSGAWLVGTIAETIGFSGSAPGLATCGGCATTTGVMRS